MLVFLEEELSEPVEFDSTDRLFLLARDVEVEHPVPTWRDVETRPGNLTFLTDETRANILTEIARFTDQLDILDEPVRTDALIVLVEQVEMLTDYLNYMEPEIADLEIFIYLSRDLFKILFIFDYEEDSRMYPCFDCFVDALDSLADRVMFVSLETREVLVEACIWFSKLTGETCDVINEIVVREMVGIDAKGGRLRQLVRILFLWELPLMSYEEQHRLITENACISEQYIQLVEDICEESDMEFLFYFC